MQSLISLCKAPYDHTTWHDQSKAAFEELFEAQKSRYGKNARNTVKFRTPKLDGDKNVPFSAIINPSAPDSGGYSGMSFVIFPVKDGHPMIAMVVGTMGLSPDEHILGTMNTADRSIAILDVAIRRRFAFVDLWPDNSVVEKLGTKESLALYQKMLSVFVEYANDDSMALVPGHSYFLDYDGMDQVAYLKTNLLPLLKEYMANGYVASFSDHIHALIQEIEAY